MDVEAAADAKAAADEVLTREKKERRKEHKQALASAYMVAKEAFDKEWEEEERELKEPVESLEKQIAEIRARFQTEREGIKKNFAEEAGPFQPLTKADYSSNLKKLRQNTRTAAERLNQERIEVIRRQGSGFGPVDVEKKVAEAQREFEEKESEKASQLQQLTDKYTQNLAAIDEAMQAATSSLDSELHQARQRMMKALRKLQQQRGKAQNEFYLEHKEGYNAATFGWESDSDDA